MTTDVCMDDNNNEQPIDVMDCASPSAGVTTRESGSDDDGCNQEHGDGSGDGWDDGPWRRWPPTTTRGAPNRHLEKVVPDSESVHRHELKKHAEKTMQRDGRRKLSLMGIADGDVPMELRPRTPAAPPCSACFFCTLRQWRRCNIALITTQPVLDCLNLGQHLQPRCLESLSAKQRKRALLKLNHFNTSYPTFQQASDTKHLTSPDTRDPLKDDSSGLSSQAPRLRGDFLPARLCPTTSTNKQPASGPPPVATPLPEPPRAPAPPDRLAASPSPPWRRPQPNVTEVLQKAIPSTQRGTWPKPECSRKAPTTMLT